MKVTQDERNGLLVHVDGEIEAMITGCHEDVMPVVMGILSNVYPEEEFSVSLNTNPLPDQAADGTVISFTILLKETGYRWKLISVYFDQRGVYHGTNLKP